MKNPNSTATQQYIQKADHFFHSMRLVADDRTAYRTGIALLAVHSAISLKDAIAVGLTGNKSRHQDHCKAVNELKELSAKHRVGNLAGVDHLRWLLTEKTRIAYGRERLDDPFILLSVNRAERFHSWAYNYFRDILHA